MICAGCIGFNNQHNNWCTRAKNKNIPIPGYVLEIVERAKLQVNFVPPNGMELVRKTIIYLANKSGIK